MSAEQFRAAPVLAGLTAFQRATVAHVMDRFFGADPTDRFLTADETGLGKSLVARGVIASVIERLQSEGTVGRIDILYICSNADIAEQNISRLNVTGGDVQPFASRLTMLAKEAHRLNQPQPGMVTPVNLVSFTPGTSFQTGHQGGKAEERALLHMLLRDHFGLSGAEQRRSRVVLSYTSELPSFKRSIERLDAHFARFGGIHPVIRDKFLEAGRAEGVIDDYRAMLDQIGQRQSVRRNTEEFRACGRLVSRLRTCLAKASVDTLEPDLIILDEFQRFRLLLDLEKGGAAAELAHDLFDHADARTLLLSATPYKPFTYAEERLAGDDHQADFLGTLRFLAGPRPERVAAIEADLARLRTAATRDENPTEITAQLRTNLLDLMCRTERPLGVGADMLDEPPSGASDLQPEDVVDLAALRAIARRVSAPFSLDYWKSAPYFVNFLSGYKIEHALRGALADLDEAAVLAPLVSLTRRLDRDRIAAAEPVDLGNARLRQLATQTVDHGWWQLLWLPPSLPYLEPAGPYARPEVQDITKRLVFSSWSATPTAVAALLSHEAQRHTAAPAAPIAGRLDFRVDGDRAAAMTTLALCWPNPALARRTDPLALIRADGREGSVSAADVIGMAVHELADEVGPDGSSHAAASEAWSWIAPFELAGSWPDGLAVDLSETTAALAGALPAPEKDTEGHEAEPTRLRTHIDFALAARDGRSERPEDRPADLQRTVARLGLNGPGNIAWRALDRQLGDHDEVTPVGHWLAAATIASGFRSLFNRSDVAVLLDSLDLSDVYWRAVLDYCEAGNLQAVMDEYVHHFRAAYGQAPLTDDTLLRLAAKVRDAISMRPAPYTAFDPTEPDTPIRFSARFALRYGNKQQSEDDVRQPVVRNAFNSPFWPFVLASTSVGQEGIDLHWWCHAVVHWNTPANPVDFDQREGRVHRYGGHAIRKNVAARHRASMIGSEERDPWVAGYRAGEDRRAEFGELAPHWVYPGPAKVLRVLLPSALSADVDRIQRLKDDVALYRLTLGQPRQEDLLDLLRREGVASDPERAAGLRLDLTPPALSPGADAELVRDDGPAPVVEVRSGVPEWQRRILTGPNRDRTIEVLQLAEQLGCRVEVPGAQRTDYLNIKAPIETTWRARLASVHVRTGSLEFQDGSWERLGSPDGFRNLGAGNKAAITLDSAPAVDAAKHAFEAEVRMARSATPGRRRADVLGPDLLELLRDVADRTPVLATLGGGRRNRIAAVASEGVRMETSSSIEKGSGPALVPAWMIEVAWAHLRASGSLTRTYLQADDGLGVRRSSAVCTLLAQLPGVSVASSAPIELRYEPLGPPS